MNRRPRLLIADDEPSVRALLQMLFEQQGYEVTTARDGRDAVERACQSRPDVMIFDIQMPHLTGIEAVEILRAEPGFEGVPVIALTAHIRDYLPSTVSKAGFSHILTKPFDIPDLLEVVASAARGSLSAT